MTDIKPNHHTNTPEGLSDKTINNLLFGREPDSAIIEQVLGQSRPWGIIDSVTAREQLERLYGYWLRRETTGSASAAKPPAQGISPKGIESESKVGDI